MLHSFLKAGQAELLRDEKQVLADVQLALRDLPVPREQLATLRDATLQLDELFLLVAVGEFNAGKSALVNALLGERVLPEGVTPTTAQVTLVKWGPEKSSTIIAQDLAEVTYPLPLLQEINIVDTPGTNAVIRRHERLTNEFVPRSDLVLFVTSADRPMTESERQFLERIRDWGKKIVIALNKADILQAKQELDEVQAFVKRHAEDVLGLEPEIFPVSARLAQQANSETDPAKRKQLLEASGLGHLIHFIDTTLDDSAKIRLKLSNPVGVAQFIIQQAQSVANEQEHALKEDSETVHAVQTVVSGYESDLQNELTPRLSEIDNVLYRLQERGLDFFDSTMRLTNIFGLARGDQVRAQFERQVLDDVPAQIEQRVHGLIDWLVEKDLHEWQQVMAYLQRRRALAAEPVVTAATEPLDARRRALIDSVGKTAQNIVETYNRDAEAHDLAVNVEASVAQVALIEAGAVGLGAIITTAIASSALDITGLVAAGTVAIVGFFIIPYKRARAKEEFKTKISTLRGKLAESLTGQFQSEANSSLTRMKETVAPYTRFVRAEQERIDLAQQALASLHSRITTLKARAENI